MSLEQSMDIMEIPVDQRELSSGAADYLDLVYHLSNNDG